MLDWLIVGGGIHGVHTALCLTKRAGVPTSRLAILDPHATLLARWTRLTDVVDMEYLRSPNVHHLGVDVGDLDRFARRHAYREYGGYREPYRRPAYLLFQDHAAQLIEEAALASCHLQGAATGLERLANGWQVRTTHGAVAARRVVLAIGRTATYWPGWARHAAAQGLPIAHIFDPDSTYRRLPTAGSVIIIGGGISAAQMAVSLAARLPGQVTLLMRHAVRTVDFDSPPCWIGPKCMAEFWASTDYIQRRAMIRSARQPGSMPRDVARSLEACVAAGSLRRVQGEIAHAEVAPQGVCLQLAQGPSLYADHVLLATGFDRARPGADWLDAAIAEHELPCAPCGYPVVDQGLQWAPRLMVIGPLAELELGPTAPNIIGARHAAERLLRAG
jgi:hypothetical protein